MPIRLPLASIDTPCGSCDGSVTVNVDGAAAALPGRVPLSGALAEPVSVSVGSAGGGFLPLGGGWVAATLKVTSRATPGAGRATLTCAVVDPAATGVPLTVPSAPIVIPAGRVLGSAVTVTGASTRLLVIVPVAGAPAVAATATGVSLSAGAHIVALVLVRPSMLPPVKLHVPLVRLRSPSTWRARLESAVVATLLLARVKISPSRMARYSVPSEPVARP